MKTANKPVLILLFLFLFGMIMVTIYYASNFSKFVHYKGDETINYALSLLIASALFQGFIIVFAKKVKWLPMLLGTVGNFVLSFVIGFIIFLSAKLQGTPRELIIIYGVCYLTIFSVSIVYQARESI